MKNTKLRKLFESRGMSAAGAAKVLGISYEAVRLHLNGKGMTMKTMNLYKKKLGIPFSILMGDQDA